LRPDVDHLVVALAVGDETFGVLLFDLLNILLRLFQELDLALRDDEVVHADGHAGLGRVAVAEMAKAVGEKNGFLLAEGAVAAVDEIAELLLAHHAVDQLEGQLLGHDFVEQNAADGGFHQLGVDTHLDRGLQIQLAVIERHAHFVDGGIDAAHGGRALAGAEFATRVGALAGHVVQTEHDILRRQDDRAAVGRAQDVVGRHHEHARFHLRFQRQRHVDGHLVTVEVGVEGRANERVQLDGLAFDQQWLEGLDAQAVQRGRTVEHHRVLFDDLFENVPHLGTLFLDELLGALDGGDQAALFQLVVDERLEELERHLLGQTALVQRSSGPTTMTERPE
jgi:hypothetical protein